MIAKTILAAAALIAAAAFTPATAAPLSPLHTQAKAGDSGLVTQVHYHRHHHRWRHHRHHRHWWHHRHHHHCYRR